MNYIFPFVIFSGSEVLQKVVFLDKPFRRQQTTRDINTKFHKISLSARILHPNHMSTHKFQPNSTVQKRLASDDGTTHIYPEDCDIMDVSSLETFGTSISKTIFGSTAEKTIKEKKNSPEKPSLKNKGIESSSKISLSKESVTCSVEVNSDLEPAEETGDMNASPQVSNIGKNQSKEKSQTDTISESSSENALERISKNLSQNEQIQFNSCIQSEENYTNKKIDLMTSCSTEKMQVCPSSEPFEESNRTINFNKVTMINTEHNEKPPIEIEKDNSEDKGSLDASAGHKEMTTAAAFLKEDILEDEDSDSDPELVIHFESSDADDSCSENKTFCDKSKVKTTNFYYRFHLPIAFFLSSLLSFSIFLFSFALFLFTLSLLLSFFLFLTSLSLSLSLSLLHSSFTLSSSISLLFFSLSLLFFSFFFLKMLFDFFRRKQ